MKNRELKRNNRHEENETHKEDERDIKKRKTENGT